MLDLDRSDRQRQELSYFPTVLITSVKKLYGIGPERVSHAKQKQHFEKEY